MTVTLNITSTDIESESPGDLDSQISAFSSEIQGVPKKTLVSVQRLLEAFKNEVQMKVG